MESIEKPYTGPELALSDSVTGVVSSAYLRNLLETSKPEAQRAAGNNNSLHNNFFFWGTHHNSKHQHGVIGARSGGSAEGTFQI